MPVRAVTSRFMYRGLCSIPDILSYRSPVSLPEDEVEGKVCWISIRLQSPSRKGYSEAGLCLCIFYFAGDGQVDFDEFVALLGPKLSSAGMPDRFRGAEFDSIFWKCDMQKLTVDELKRLLYDTFCDHLTMKDIENIIMTEESHLNSPECQVDIDTSPMQQVKHTCVRKSLICAFAIAFIISVMLIAANQMLRRGMK
uniref:Calcium-binding protein 7 n=1 Tax=Cyprinus carpio TaxID=7962 RepID=A0A8C2B4G2_CYPCA